MGRCVDSLGSAAAEVQVEVSAILQKLELLIVEGFEAYRPVQGPLHGRDPVGVLVHARIGDLAFAPAALATAAVGDDREPTGALDGHHAQLRPRSAQHRNGGCSGVLMQLVVPAEMGVADWWALTVEIAIDTAADGVVSESSGIWGVCRTAAVARGDDEVENRTSSCLLAAGHVGSPHPAAHAVDHELVGTVALAPGEDHFRGDELAVVGRLLSVIFWFGGERHLDRDSRDGVLEPASCDALVLALQCLDGDALGDDREFTDALHLGDVRGLVRAAFRSSGLASTWAILESMEIPSSLLLVLFPSTAFTRAFPENSREFTGHDEAVRAPRFLGASDVGGDRESAHADAYFSGCPSHRRRRSRC